MALQDLTPALFDNYFIKLVFLIHASLFSLASITNYSNSKQLAYIAYNFLFLTIVLLSILVDRSTDIILVATAFNVICIALDVVLLISSSYMGTFTILLVVLNLVLRPATTILLLKNYSARAGVEDPTGGLLEVNVAATAPKSRSAYQNIDEPSQTLP